MDTEIRVSWENWPWRRKISRCYYWKCVTFQSRVQHSTNEPSAPTTSDTRYFTSDNAQYGTSDWQLCNNALLTKLSSTTPLTGTCGSDSGLLWFLHLYLGCPWLWWADELTEGGLRAHPLRTTAAYGHGHGHGHGHSENPIRVWCLSQNRTLAQCRHKTSLKSPNPFQAHNKKMILQVLTVSKQFLLLLLQVTVWGI